MLAELVIQGGFHPPPRVDGRELNKDGFGLVIYGDLRHEAALAGVPKPLLRHVNASDAGQTLPEGDGFLHELERVTSHVVIVDRAAATVKGSLPPCVVEACVSEAVPSAPTLNTTHTFEQVFPAFA